MVDLLCLPSLKTLARKLTPLDKKPTAETIIDARQKMSNFMITIYMAGRMAAKELPSRFLPVDKNGSGQLAPNALWKIMY
jgi:hypothetical protein